MSNTSLNILYHPSLFLNGQTRPVSDPGSFCAFLNILNIPYKIKQYNPKKDKNGILYCNFTFSNKANNKLVDFNDFKDLLKIAAGTNIQLLLWQPYESFGHFNPQFREKWNANLKILNDVGFAPQRILYVSGDILCKDTSSVNYNNMRRIGVDAFPFVTAQRYAKVPLRSINPNKKTKKFLCLNKLPRVHRSVLYYYLTKYNLIDSSIVSWTDKYEKLSLDDVKAFTFDDSRIDKVNTLPTIKLDNDIGPNRGYQDLTWYDNTVFSLVTETTVDENSLFLTEKIYKPIMIGHPFVIWGNPGTLEYLRSEGYQTFPELFDESYDIEENHAKRLEKIIKICKDTPITEWSDSVIEKIEHNKKHFSTQWRMKFVNLTQNVVTELLSYQNNKNHPK